MKLLTKLVLAAGVLSMPTAAFTAEIKKPGEFPKRPITVIVCYGKGGGSDQAVAAVQDQKSEITGVKVNKINKPGGGGLNCLPDFQQAPADGYTVLQHTDGLIASYVEGKHDMHPGKDLTPLAVTNIAPSALFVRAGDERFYENGKPSWEKVVAYAKANPGKLTVSNINIPMELVTMAKVEEFFDIKVKQVLFDKPAQRYGAVMGGKIDVLLEQPGDVSKHVEAGKLAPVLAVWPERFKIYPDTKSTGADYGKQWDPLLRVRGFWVKSDTPKEVKEYLEAVLKQAYESEKHQAFLKRKSLDIVNSYLDTASTAKLIDTAVDAYTKIFKETGQPLRKDLQ